MGREWVRGRGGGGFVDRVIDFCFYSGNRRNFRRVLRIKWDEEYKVLGDSLFRDGFL